jgi:hypothetical protein
LPAADPATLPFLLLGPMLRRVEADLASVLIATSRPCTARLRVWQGDAAGEPGWVSTAQPTVSLGAHLHVVVVVLDLATGGTAETGSGSFLPGTEHSYDVQLVEGTTTHDLGTLGLLAGLHQLGYADGKRPRFVTPPTDPAELVLLHGSCRQIFDEVPLDDQGRPTDEEGTLLAEGAPFEPPGGWPPEPGAPAPGAFPAQRLPGNPKLDGLRWVDVLLDRRGPGPHVAPHRPHQLFLTGDQIYADDVPSVFLAALNHLGRLLVGPETLSWWSPEGVSTAGVSASTFTAPAQLASAPGDLDHFPPGLRKPIVLELGGFTTGDGGSHLLTFGEVCAYYLLAWSPTLWDWEGLFPEPEDYGRTGTLYGPDPQRPWLDATFTADPQHPVPAEDVVGVVDGYRERVDRDLQHVVTREDCRWWSRRFRQDLPRVRRALANVPTYMILDDHEVTDDFYTSRQWREQVTSSPLGVSIVRNTLAAYTIFQHWGNVPRPFRTAGSPEGQLLERIVQWVASPATAALPLQASLGLPTADPSTQTLRPLVSFSYRVDAPGHRVLVLDGRTTRRFPTRTATAGSLDFAGSDGLFGSSPMGQALPEPAPGDERVVFVVAPVPVLGPDGMELALVPFQQLTRMGLSIDAEAWAYEPGNYEALLWALSRYRKVVLLSGDIHMGFSCALDYWSAWEGEPVRTARIAQLTSSGLTQTWGRKTGIFTQNALLQEILATGTTEDDPAERIGWGKPVKLSLEPATDPITPVNTGTAKAHPSLDARLSRSPKVVPTQGWPAGTTESSTPNWAWRCWMVEDERPEAAPGEEVDATKRWAPLPTPVGLTDRADAMQRHRYGRIFAYATQIGVVTLRREGADWVVRHTLAGELPQENVRISPPALVVPSGLREWVVHEIPLTPPATSTWTDTGSGARPRIGGTPGWEVDSTDPSVVALLQLFPKWWSWAVRELGGLVPTLPLGLTGAARDAALAEIADSVSVPFRRALVRDLGPFRHLADAQADAVDDAQIAAVAPGAGPLSVLPEARARVMPDVKRLLSLAESGTSDARLLDDALLLAASAVLHERLSRPDASSLGKAIWQIAMFVTLFRQPLFKQGPVTRDLLLGLWDVWRHHTLLDWWIPPSTTGPARIVAGVPAILPRLVAFALQVGLLRGVPRIFTDPAPATGEGPGPLPPELALAGLGLFLAFDKPRRLQVTSGWELQPRPTNVGARRGDRTPQTLARQQLALLLYPEDATSLTQSPLASISLGLWPPDPTAAAEEDRPARLGLGMAGGGSLSTELGAGFRLSLDLDGHGEGWLPMPPDPDLPAATLGGLRATLSLERPFELELGSVSIACTPALRAIVGTAGPNEGTSPYLQLVLTLQDAQDALRILPEQDGFLSRLLPTSGLPIPLDLSVGWHSQRGLEWLGVGDALRPLGSETVPGSVPDLDPSTPMRKKLGLLTLDQRDVGLAFESEDGRGGLVATITGRLTLSLGPVRLAVLGFGGRIGALAPADPDEDLLDLVFEPAWPTGLAVSVQHSMISGAGFVERRVSATGTTWRGGLSLRVGDRVDVAAFGVVTTGPAGWSVLVFLSGHIPPVPLGLGFRLTRVGGVLGLHRAMDLDRIGAAVLAEAASAELLLFPQDPQAHLPELLSLAEQWLPRQEGSHVFGPLVELDWSLAGQVAARLRAALLVQLGGFKAALVGVARIGLPSLEQDHVFSARAGLVASYDHEAGVASFALELQDAKLFRTIDLEGGAALFARWKGDRAFALSLGGFHPRFRPYIPQGMREPSRLAAHWHPADQLQVDLQAYFAVTHTSVQAGGAVHVYAGASWGHAEGDLGLDLMIFWSPDFRLEADLSARVSVTVFGADLITASLKGSISGPGPWHLEATASWSVCGVDLSKHVEYTWGSGQTLPAGSVSAGLVLEQALLDESSWSTVRDRRAPVLLRAGAVSVLPTDKLELRQTLLPLGTRVERSERRVLTDPGVWTLLGAGIAQTGTPTDVFPSNRYLAKVEKGKEFSPPLPVGGQFSADGACTAGAAVADGPSEHEDSVIDDPSQLTTGPRAQALLLDDLLAVAAPTRSTERAFVRHLQLVEVSS